MPAPKQSMPTGRRALRASAEAIDWLTMNYSHAGEQRDSRKTKDEWPLYGKLYGETHRLRPVTATHRTGTNDRCRDIVAVGGTELHGSQGSFSGTGYLTPTIKFRPSLLDRSTSYPVRSPMSRYEAPSSKGKELSTEYGLARLRPGLQVGRCCSQAHLERAMEAQHGQTASAADRTWSSTATSSSTCPPLNIRRQAQPRKSFL